MAGYTLAELQAEAARRRAASAGGGGAAAAPQYDAGGMEHLPGGYLRNRPGQTFRIGPRGGMGEPVNGLGRKQIDDAMTTATGISQALAGIDRVDRQYDATGNIGPLGVLTNNTELAVLKQSTRDLMLRMKEQPYNLGVLNGPDLEIMDQIIADPNTLDSMVFRAKLKPLLANLSSLLGDQYRLQSDQYGSLGGREDALPPLYRSPRSKYTPQEFGREGRVPPNALARTGPPAPASATTRVPRQSRVPPTGLTPAQRKAAAAFRGTRESSGTMGNPSIPNSEAQYNALPPGTVYLDPDGVRKTKKGGA